mmetsp:Transcript_1841/g.4760  ORF Transcript_1841/g.4760 Transcript_1841/m.4760 type:complete len:282 (-) Transcript_1841:315-1160(-)
MHTNASASGMLPAANAERRRKRPVDQWGWACSACSTMPKKTITIPVALCAPSCSRKATSEIVITKTLLSALPMECEIASTSRSTDSEASWYALKEMADQTNLLSRGGTPSNRKTRKRTAMAGSKPTSPSTSSVCAPELIFGKAADFVSTRMSGKLTHAKSVGSSAREKLRPPPCLPAGLLVEVTIVPTTITRSASTSSRTEGLPSTAHLSAAVKAGSLDLKTCVSVAPLEAIEAFVPAVPTSWQIPAPKTSAADINVILSRSSLSPHALDSEHRPNAAAQQ